MQKVKALSKITQFRTRRSTSKEGSWGVAMSRGKKCTSFPNQGKWVLKKWWKPVFVDNEMDAGIAVEGLDGLICPESPRS